MDVSIDGLTFHVQELGKRSERPSIVMLHGLFLGSIASWYFSAAPALAKSRHVVLFDLRGHGMSSRAKTGYDLRTMARDLAQIADRFTEGPIDLVGHSYGALVALRFALDHKRRARSLALVEAPLPPSSFREMDEFLGRSAEDMMEALPSFHGARGVPSREPGDSSTARGVPSPDASRLRGRGDASIVARGVPSPDGRGGRRAARLLASLRFLAGESSLLADLRAEGDVPDDDLRRLDLPVLAVYGDRSSCRHVGDRLARVVDGARLVVLSGGHYLHLDAPAELTRTLEEFLDG
jgi:pimeloyl-ACP methyl ester carboxylesterase